MRAAILAAGYGGRMPIHFPNFFHKTLHKNLNGNHITGSIIKSLVSNNINDIIIVTGYKRNQLKNHLNNSFPEVSFQFIHNDYMIKLKYF